MERTLDPARLGDHIDRLYRAAWALCGSREDAEDLVQETYARVLARPRRSATKTTSATSSERCATRSWPRSD
jgi:DNA-directed RNA polymerase specialized sigma24 family protein